MNFIQKSVFVLTTTKIFLYYLINFLRQRPLKQNSLHAKINEENIVGKVVIVTGGSLGIGKLSAKEFARRGAVVVIGDVDLKTGQKAVEEIKQKTANNNVRFLKLDLSDLTSVEQFVQQVQAEYPKLKILLNNTGIESSPNTKIISTKDGINKHVAVTYMGHFLLTNLLLHNLEAEAKSRVVTTSLAVRRFSKIEAFGITNETSEIGIQKSSAYENTKFFNALFTQELAKRVAGTGIRTYTLCPGIVNTSISPDVPKANKKGFSLFMNSSLLSTDEAAVDFIMHCSVDESTAKESGQMYQFNKYFRAAKERLDDELACRLWEQSSKLVKLEERLVRIKTCTS